jgi:nicotinamidase-related amidase
MSTKTERTAKTALLVIDVQESFRHRPYFETSGLASFFEKTQKLVSGFQARKLPVVRILHVEPEGAFSLASGWVTPMRELEYTPDVTFQKTVHSALAGTGLGAWLTQSGISRLVVSGIRTEQCCETTTRHASDSGFSVDYVPEATLTFAMRHANGRTYTPDEIRERTELVLAGRFATICTVDEALERAR